MLSAPGAFGLAAQDPPPLLEAAAVSLFSSCRIESRCASSLAFSLLPSVACKPVISALTVSRMLCRRFNSAAAEVFEPAGMAAPNTVL